MHKIEPYYQWYKYYESSEDEKSPFFGKQYNYDLYSDTIYGYYIDPGWDYMGSETLYIKILYTNYELGCTIIEFIGEWNDAINNDIMNLKRNIIDQQLSHGINKFILIGENVLNFHGSDDCYYEEWREDTEEGWIVAMNFRDFVMDEMRNYNVDSYLETGEEFDIINWRTMQPENLFYVVNDIIRHRIEPASWDEYEEVS
jgi:hypothetical protein